MSTEENPAQSYSVKTFGPSKGRENADVVVEGRLADNIIYFARTLRKAGMRIGPAAVIDALRAVEVSGIGSREEFYWVLHSVLVNRHEDHATFDEAFRLYWRSRELVEKMLAMFSPQAIDNSEKEKQRAAQSRVSQALFAEKEDERPVQEMPEIEVDARFTFSGSEVLRQKDFAQMTIAELEEAKQAFQNFRLPEDLLKTRRYRADNRGKRIDMRSTLRASMRTGGDLIALQKRSQRLIHPPLVALADVSGSMSQYSRLFLHFLHALTMKRRRVHSFVFGTRLTNLTRQLRHRDGDDAVMDATEVVKDWSGGTRIGETLGEFNRIWSRRVLGQGATVLLITDGLERDGVEELSKQMERLHKSCRRLIWLNPLLRFDGFEARAQGVRAMLPHVDDFRAVHNLEALGDLVQALGNDKIAHKTAKQWLAQ